MNCNFEQINDYYFIVVNNVYSYAMTFKDGFQFLRLYTSNKTIIKELTAVAYPLKNACFDSPTLERGANPILNFLYPFSFAYINKLTNIKL